MDFLLLALPLGPGEAEPLRDVRSGIVDEQLVDDGPIQHRPQRGVNTPYGLGAELLLSAARLGLDASQQLHDVAAPEVPHLHVDKRAVLVGFQGALVGVVLQTADVAAEGAGIGVDGGRFKLRCGEGQPPLRVVGDGDVGIDLGLQPLLL